MSLKLTIDSPDKVTAKSFDANYPLQLWFTESLNAVEIGNEDFAQLVWYWFTNTDLIGDDDPRMILLAKLRNFTIVAGFNPGGFRFENSNLPCVEKEIANA